MEFDISSFASVNVISFRLYGASLCAIAAGCLFYSAYRIAIGGVKGKIFYITALLGLALSAFEVQNAYKAPVQLSQAAEAYTSMGAPPSVEEAALLKPNAANQLLAKNVYLKTGKISEFLGDDGLKRRFVPTDEEIQLRDSYVKEQGLFEYAIRLTMRTKDGVIVLCIFSIFLGLGLGRIDRK